MASPTLNSDHSDYTGRSRPVRSAAELLQMSFTVRAIKSLVTARLKRDSVLDHFLCVHEL